MVAKYDRHGIAFVYPDNWRVNEDAPQHTGHCVSLQSPGSGFWMLQVLDSQKKPERLASEALRSVKLEYGDAEVDRVEEQIEGISAVGYDMQFYCLDFAVSASIRSFSVDDRAFVLLYQAEYDEFERIAPVFLAITTSLLNATKRVAAEQSRPE